VKDEKKSTLIVQIEHVDGTFNAERRNERLNWLEDDTDDNICRVLTNARCLSERYTARPYQASACYRDSAVMRAHVDRVEHAPPPALTRKSPGVLHVSEF